jgi:Ca2+-binding RTX toxin-like protein
VTFDGSAETDGSFVTYAGLGTDHVVGGQQSDAFFFGVGHWGAFDSVDGQGGLDELGLQGNYTAAGSGAIVFGGGQLTNVEVIVCVTGGDARFGAPTGQGYSYDLTMNDGNVAAGQTLYISANRLQAAGGTLLADETLTFDGSHETNGRFVIYSGAGADYIVGGAGGDTIYGGGGGDMLTGGGGKDVFAYISADHSTASAMDQILDFAGGDSIDLARIDADGSNGAFAFVGVAAFSHTAGELRAIQQSPGHWQVEGDVDGDGTADLVISVTTDHALTSADFVL